MDTGRLKAWSSDLGSTTLDINHFTTVLGTGDIKEDKTGSIASESINPVGGIEVQMSVLQYKSTVRRHRGHVSTKSRDCVIRKGFVEGTPGRLSSGRGDGEVGAGGRCSRQRAWHMRRHLRVKEPSVYRYPSAHRTLGVPSWSYVLWLKWHVWGWGWGCCAPVLCWQRLWCGSSDGSSGTRKPKYNSQAWTLLAARPWAYHFTFLCLSFLTCQIWVIGASNL